MISGFTNKQGRSQKFLIEGAILTILYIRGAVSDKYKKYETKSSILDKHIYNIS